MKKLKLILEPWTENVEVAGGLSLHQNVFIICSFISGVHLGPEDKAFPKPRGSSGRMKQEVPCRNLVSSLFSLISLPQDSRAQTNLQTIKPETESSPSALDPGRVFNGLTAPLTSSEGLWCVSFQRTCILGFLLCEETIGQNIGSKYTDCN